MKEVASQIVTVGLSPCWDTTLHVDGADWGRHERVGSASSQPAGKALNVSLALAWMGQKSIAAGLWGRDDYEQMLKAMRPLRRWISVRMTSVRGDTRRNITIVDTLNAREMHLRSESELASRQALGQLRTDLGTIISSNSACVFAGQMPQEQLLPEVVRIIKSCVRLGAGVVLDSSGELLGKVVRSCTTWLIKPNVEELRELLNERVRDEPVVLARAGRKLLGRTCVVLISRADRGAVVVTEEGAWQGRVVGCERVLSTVGCGDYLLAGFLKALKESGHAGSALVTGIKVAAAKAWGWTEERNWEAVRQEIAADVEPV